MLLSGMRLCRAYGSSWNEHAAASKPEGLVSGLIETVSVHMGVELYVLLSLSYGEPGVSAPFLPALPHTVKQQI